MESEYKFIHADELPEKGSGRPKTSTYPFESLKNNLDGFVAGKYSDYLSKELSSQCKHYGEKLDATFVTRKVGEFLHVYKVE